MKKKYIVTLTQAERQQLSDMIAAGKGAARRLAHARILLKADQSPDGPGLLDDAIAEAVEVSRPTVERVRKLFVEEGLQTALNRRLPRRTYLRKLDGEQEARLIAEACSAPPEGNVRWTLRLLADRLVELEIVDSVSHETVRQVLKKNELKPWLKKQWVIPPEANGEFVWHMEDVLDVYTRPYDPRRPQVCMDELPQQLIGETREPLPMQPGQPERIDYEYVRNGVASVFMCCEPLRGWRQVTVTDQRTCRDWAHVIKELADVEYPQAEVIVLVLDNLNTHTPASLYETFPPAEAKRLLKRLEIHHTPKHGSWLNMAEIELSVLARQCLDRRIPNKAVLTAETAAWEAKRNALGGTINWRFTTDDARIKLKRLYPTIEA